MRHALSASPLFSKVPIKEEGRKYAWRLAHHPFIMESDECSLATTPATIGCCYPRFVGHRRRPTPTSPSRVFLGETMNRQLMMVDTSVETDPITIWLPLPRDPLSDLVGLPPILVPDDVLYSQQSALFPI